MKTKIEIIKRTKEKGIFYYVYIDGVLNDVFELLESAEERFQQLEKMVRFPVIDEVIKSIEI